MFGNKKPADGFSLLEVLISLSVLAVGLIGMIAMFGSGYMKLKGGDDRTVAVQLAQNKMEALRFLPWSKVSDGDASQDNMTIGWSIDPTGDPNIRLITVDVSWLGSKKKMEKLTLKSFRAF